MVSRMTIALDRTYLAHASGIDDSEGNAKRVMLFGTALLTTIDILLKERISSNPRTRTFAMSPWYSATSSISRTT